MTCAKIREVLALLDAASFHAVEVASLLPVMSESGTRNRVIRDNTACRDKLRQAKAMLQEELTKREAWCDGCGQGRTGETAKADGSLGPCAVCHPKDEGFA